MGWSIPTGGRGVSEPRCYHCGTWLSDINAPCPNCLPNFYDPKQPAPTRPDSPALDRLKELVDGPDGLNWIHAKLKDLYSAAHVDPNQISERMARDIVRAVHEGGDEILDEFARIKLGLSRALRIIEELKHE